MGIGRALTEANDERTDIRNSSVDMQWVQQLEPAIVGEVHTVQATETRSTDDYTAGGEVDVPSPAPDEPQPEPSPAVYEPATGDPYGAEAIICRHFACPKGLRVAACESGNDYYADWDGAHIGTFQLYPGHAWRFENHGWDYFRDGTDIEKNSIIAREVYNERGWSAWPVCGYR